MPILLLKKINQGNWCITNKPGTNGTYSLVQRIIESFYIEENFLEFANLCWIFWFVD